MVAKTHHDDYTHSKQPRCLLVGLLPHGKNEQNYYCSLSLCQHWKNPFCACNLASQPPHPSITFLICCIRTMFIVVREIILHMCKIESTCWCHSRCLCNVPSFFNALHCKKNNNIPTQSQLQENNVAFSVIITTGSKPSLQVNKTVFDQREARV